MTLNDVDCTPVFRRTAQDGEKIILTITQTCPDLFEYTVVPIPLPPEERPQAGTPCTGTKTVEIQHDPQYGGYIVNIVAKAGATPNAGNARLTISVLTSEWKLGFAGGFSLTGLKDPPYALKEIQPAATGGATVTKYRLIEQKSRGDAVGRAVASFVHLHHTKRPLLGISFGLGIEPDRAGDYYVGPSLLFGDRAAFTVGMVTGQVKSPPSGREVNDTLTDANTLANLGRRRIAKLFVSLSYRFLGGGAADLKKPFAGSSPPATGTTGTTGGGTGGTATALKVEKVGPEPAALRAGDTSDTLRIQADAPNAVVRWLFANGSDAAADGRTDSLGVAKATIKIDSTVTDSTVTVRAMVSTTTTPIKTGSVDFVLKIIK